MKTAVQTDNAPKAIGPYSQAVVANGLVYCSGQIAIDPSSGQVVPGDITQQTERVMRNLDAVLQQAGSSLKQVLRATVYLRSMTDFAAMNEVYGKWISSGVNVPPARSTVAVAGLPRDVLVEIDVIASLGD